MEDLKVFYRMCGIKSTNPSPWSQEDKYKLNYVCLKSFLMGMSDIKIKIHFLLDFCDKRYDDLVKEYGSFEHSEIGINGTMLKAYDLASKEHGYILLAECDYLWRPKIGRRFLEAVQNLDIVSPYDHRNFYIDSTIHSSTCEIRLINETHYRSTERNTMTWGCHSDLIREHLDTFLRHGYLDDKIWWELWLSGKRLWVPIPSMSTHCVTDYLAPGINWEQIWKAYE
jgi:hypothetical protein